MNAEVEAHGLASPESLLRLQAIDQLEVAAEILQGMLRTLREKPEQWSKVASLYASLTEHLARGMNHYDASVYVNDCMGQG